MSDPKHPKVGDLVIDASDIEMTDIRPVQMHHLAKTRDGFDVAVKNLLGLRPEDANRAGFDEKDKERLAAAFARDLRIGELLPAAHKLTELLHETRQVTRHEIATLLAEAAAQAKRRADCMQNGAEVLGPLVPLLDYQVGPARNERAREAKHEG
ncbi:hypothetical protein [Polyangium sp. 6x1]|uniref:hypothetical protein n=1 Tax=Polyangium sp. 6x1 TaxID=3042689 RepID=UPI00248240A2|nr:hypothetical protein [Polyangium sp. 6x1]MDI1448548.1 hypothetical protein [Polyangium sp. 6x1]